MSDHKPQKKIVTYETLMAEVDYKTRKMTITHLESGEVITIESTAYPELVAIMADIGHQIPQSQSTYQRK